MAQMAQAPAPPAELPGVGAETAREKAAAPAKSNVAAAPERDETGRSLVAQRPSAKAAADVRADAAPPAVRARDKKPAEPAAETMAARGASEEKRTQMAAAARLTRQSGSLKFEDDGHRLGPGAVWSSARVALALRRRRATAEQVSGVTADLLASAIPADVLDCQGRGHRRSHHGERWSASRFRSRRPGCRRRRAPTAPSWSPRRTPFQTLTRRRISGRRWVNSVRRQTILRTDPRRQRSAGRPCSSPRRRKLVLDESLAFNQSLPRRSAEDLPSVMAALPWTAAPFTTGTPVVRAAEDAAGDT
jgi:hypothetical protein